MWFNTKRVSWIHFQAPKPRPGVVLPGGRTHSASQPASQPVIQLILQAGVGEHAGKAQGAKCKVGRSCAAFPTALLQPTGLGLIAALLLPSQPDLCSANAASTRLSSLRGTRQCNELVSSSSPKVSSFLHLTSHTSIALCHLRPSYA